MSVIELFLNALMVGASASIGAYVGGRLMYRHIKNDAKPTLEHYINSEQGRNALYGIGIVLGNAIMSGAGLQKPTKSAGGLNGLIMQGLSMFLGQRNQGQAQQQPQAQQNFNPYQQP